jgi:GNAT superfamily N-acetyltransferase
MLPLGIPRVINYRPMTLDDVEYVPLGCQGSHDDIEQRINELGATAILAFEGEQHVAQLQFRRYDPNLRSPDGLWDPLYWGDFGEHAPDLLQNSLSVFCYHVGQLEDTEARDVRYQGRGIGLAMLDSLLAWADKAGFEAIAAKCTPPDRPVMSFMGGQPADAYRERGFELVASWVDRQLREVIQQKALVAEDADMDSAARVGCCVKRFR